MRVVYTLIMLFWISASAQQSNSVIDSFLKRNYSITSNSYEIKSSIENNPNYSVYYLQQKYNGIEIHNSISTLSIKGDEVKSFSNRFTDLKSTKVEGSIIKIDSKTAINNSLIELTARPDIDINNIIAKLKYVKSDENKGLKLSWNFNFLTDNHKYWYNIFVDTESGKVIKVENWMVKCSFENKDEIGSHNHNHEINLNQNLSQTNDGSSYNVVSLPSPSPNHGPFEVLVEPADPSASPYGWHDTDGVVGPEYTITRGNNVYAKEDDEGDGSMSGIDYSPDGGTSLTFNFDNTNLDQPPAEYMDLAITNLFYTNNMMHDIWYRYGFDEISGNFQENNYGNGGQGSDSVNADGQDGSGFNNASFGTPPDGQNPQMTMFLWNGPAGDALTVLNGSLAGSYTGQPAAFGDPLPTDNALTGELSLLYDQPDFTEAEPDPHDACQTITNPSELVGKIVVIRRGTCEFGSKILAAENAGALAVIMVNNEPGGPISMGAGADGDSVTIPSIMIGQTDGEALIAELQASQTINVSLINATNYTDSNLDNEIIAHEYGHGISNRLMGGAQAASCMTNAEQQGEGFSDWFGLMITLSENDSPALPRGVATYSAGQTPNGNGIRNAPYSPDFNVNNYTYADSNDTANVSQPHGVGFVFATMLWDLTWAFIDEYGFDPDLTNGNGGNNKVMQLVIDGLKLAPCNAGFVEMRDAILLADLLTNNNQNECIIWNAFANRGLGYLADQGDADNRTDQIEDFSLPPSCQAATNQLDAGILSIDAPSTAVLTNSENISVTIRNYGVNSISNFDIYYSVNSSNQIVETVNQTIESGQNLSFTFTNQFDFSSPGEYTIVSGTLLTGDEDSSNDEISIIIISEEATNCPDNYELPIAWRDNFECYDPFIISDIGDWIMYDLDGGTTWGANAVDFENESYVGTGIIYNDELATVTGAEVPEWNTYEGDQGLYFIASGSGGTTTPNDDWMISPEFSLNNVSSPIFSFKAKSVNDTYGLERIQVYVGNTVNYNDFTMISSGNYIEVPTVWTTYEFDLSEYQDQNIRVAIRYVSNDSFVLQTDSFKVEGTLSISENDILNFDYYYDRFNQRLNVNSDEFLNRIEVYNLIGQRLFVDEINGFSDSINLNYLSPSIYLFKVHGVNGVKLFKLLVD